MNPDLPKKVPIAVTWAVDTALKEGLRIEDNRSVAESAHRAHRELARQQERDSGKAEAIIAWCQMVYQALRSDDLYDIYHPVIDDGLMISLFNHEDRLAAQATAPEGLLRTELTIDLNPFDSHADGYVSVRHHEWFDGYRVAGGGIVNTPTALMYSLFPDTLDRLYDHIVEGTAWERIVAELKRLPQLLKDR